MTGKITTKLMLHQLIGATLLIGSIFLVIALPSITKAAPYDHESIEQFPLNTPGGSPTAIETDGNGSMWFGLQGSDYLGKIVSDGTIIEYPLPSGTTTIGGLTRGADGSMWFTSQDNDYVGRIRPNGTVTEFLLDAGSAPTRIITAGNGDMWFSATGGSYIGRITSSGTVTKFPISAGSNPLAITFGPDGSIWFSATGTNMINKMSQSGIVLAAYPMLTPVSGPSEMSVGADGRIWFNSQYEDYIGAITVSGVITEYSMSGDRAYGIANGPDGKLWFTAPTGGYVGSITTGGVISKYFVSPGSIPYAIKLGFDNNLWYTDLSGAIGKILLEQPPDNSQSPQETTPAAVMPIKSGDTIPGAPNAGYGKSDVLDYGIFVAVSGVAFIAITPYVYRLLGKMQKGRH